MPSIPPRARATTALLRSLRSLPAAALLALLVGLTAAVTEAEAQERDRGSIEGRVVLAEEGEPLPGLDVLLVELRKRTTTDGEGRYAFRDVPRGVYTLRFSVPEGVGPRETRVRQVRVNPGRTARLDVELRPTGFYVEDELQVTATRSQRRSSEVPAPVNTITEAEIDRRQVRKPGDLFALEPGLEVEGSGPFLGKPVIRGLTGNRVLVLVDGHRLNNSREAINFGGVEPGLVDIGQIQRVEVIRGPASVLYGSDAIGGVVNIITERPPVPEQGLEVGGRLEPRFSTADDQESGFAEAWVATPDFSLSVNGSLRDAENFESADGDVPNSAAETQSVNAKAEVRPADGHRILLDYQRFRGDDVGVPGTGGVFTGSFPFTDRDKAALRYEGRGLGSVVSTLDASVFYQKQEENFRSVLDLPPIPAGPFQLFIESDAERVSDVTTTGVDVQATTLLGENQVLTYGVDFFRDDVDENRREVTTREFVPTGPFPQGRTEVDTATSPTTPDGSFQGLGFYLQDEISVGRFEFTPGLRYDRFDIETDRLERPEGVLPAEDRTEDAISGNLGALYRLTETVNLTANFGRAFRTPNIIERFFFGPGSQGGLTVPNPDLENETSLNVDAGVKAETERFRGSVTYFRNEVDDFITFTAGTFQGDSTIGGQPVSMVDNVDEARIQGVEMEGEVVADLLGSRWQFFGNMTWNRGTNLADDEPVFVAPLKGVLGLLWTDGSGRFTAEVTSRLVAGQDRVPPGFEETEGFGVYNANVAARIPFAGRGATLRLGVENFTDEAYREPFNANLSPGINVVSSVEIAVN
jgi:hemoglobin/transferrin/lactoferrin receptor protein